MNGLEVPSETTETTLMSDMRSMALHSPEQQSNFKADIQVSSTFPSIFASRNVNTQLMTHSASQNTDDIICSGN